MSDGYNGWTNYPTWCVTLWLDNEPESQAHSHALVLRTYKDALTNASAFYSTDAQAYARSYAADALKEYVDENLANDRTTMGSDLQSWALGQVNWREIVTTWLEDDLKDDEDDEDDDD